MTTFLDGPWPRAFAHRGWHCGDLAGRENSMVAFRRAVDEGYTYLETDVHVSADGRLLAFHDVRLDRVTDAHGLIADLDWDTLSQARIGGREPIPLFTDVIDLMHEHPQLRVNVDPKTDRSVGPLLDAVRDSGLADRFCIGSFTDQRLTLFRRLLGPELATSLGPREVVRLVARSRTRRSGRRHTAVAAQIPERLGRITVLTPQLLRQAHAEGLEVHVWTIDDAPTMHRLLDLGADGIMTDRPDVLRTVLRDRGRWPS